MPRRRFRRREEERVHKVVPTEQEESAKPAGKAEALMQLQRTLGNQYVQRVLAGEEDSMQRASVQKEADEGPELRLVDNPDARDDTQKGCRELMPTGLAALLRAKSKTEQGVEPPSDASLKATIAKYAKYRLLNVPAEFEFTDERYRVTRGENEPEALTDKVEDQIVKTVKDIEGWHLFGLSIMDATRSVLLAVDNRIPSARRIYWIDRAEGGFKDVTGRVDERVTQLSKELWRAQPPDVRQRTRVMFWPFAPV